MSSEEIREKISSLYNFQLANPFPYEDTSRMKIDVESDFELSEGESLNANFNDYCTLIVGTTSYILNGNVANIPEKQIEFLNEGFSKGFLNTVLLKQNWRTILNLKMSTLIMKN
nr:YxiJ family protein [Paenibacillus lutimineralis]